MPTVALQPWQMARNDQKIPKIQIMTKIQKKMPKIQKMPKVEKKAKNAK